MQLAKVSFGLPGRAVLHELEQIGRNARPRRDQKPREHGDQRTRRFVGAGRCRRLGHDDRAIDRHAHIIGLELDRLLEKPFTGLERDECPDLERKAIAALLEVIYQLADADVSTHRSPSVPLGRTHTNPVRQQVLLDLCHSVVAVMKD